MASKAVPLVWHCKTPDGWRRLPAVVGSKGKLRPRYAQVGGNQILYREGHYELRCSQDGTRIWKNVGEDAAHALSEQTKALKGTQKAEPPLKPASTLIKIPFEGKLDTFVARQITRAKLRHARIAARDVKDFIDETGVNYAHELDEAKVLAWYDSLRAKGNSAYTIHNKHIMIFGFLKWCGVVTKSLAREGPPGYVAKKPKMYKPEELEALFAAMRKPYHRVVFTTLLQTGLREQEAMYLEADNFDFAKLTLTVLARDNGFTIKDAAERTLPITLICDKLQRWIAAHPGQYVLGTGRGKINGEWLPALKRIARRAALNCGRCKSCKNPKHQGANQNCERWLLKTFRSTYTTKMLRSGVDPRTLMEYTGHADMKTILKYLVPAEGEDAQSRIKSIAWF